TSAAKVEGYSRDGGAGEHSYNRGTRVYVGGLNENVKKEDLEMKFKSYGKLNNVWVAFNPPGFAFIEFENEDEAEVAVDNLNGAEVLGAKLRVEISRGRGRGRGGFRGPRGRGGGQYFQRGSRSGFRGSRGDYSSRGGGFRSSRGGRGGPRGSRGRYDDYPSSRDGGSYGRDYDQNDKYSSRSENNGSDYYRPASSRFRSRSPVGRGSSRDYGGKDSDNSYGGSGRSSMNYSDSYQSRSHDPYTSRARDSGNTGGETYSSRNGFGSGEGY
ncbi:RNA-binding protein Rsf1-like, partial [Ischnura elegans]|uniref:RNA-binding protein Rsf1-like n=1 Tax=Ischnura elegans TaxID=197161 RepID=UPI001ED88329